MQREREREANERRRADEARFEGGPCFACGATYSAQAEWPNLDKATPGWSRHLRGWKCATCLAWRAGQPDDYLLDMVATIVRDEGFDELGNPNRTRFHVVPRLAEQMGVQAWCDADDAPVGSSWLHLAGIREAYAAECEAREVERLAALAERDRSPELDADARACYRIGWTVEAEVAWAQMTADQHNGVKRTISEAEADRMEQRRRKQIEKAGRR